MNPIVKFGALVTVIVGTLVWLAAGGVSESKTYYKEIKEVQHLNAQAREQKLRVGGFVENGSIVRSGREVRFELTQDNLKMTVVYNGIEPLPDTFKDGAQALAEGKLGTDGVFHASKIQAKCASKYEAKPGQGRNAAVRAS